VRARRNVGAEPSTTDLIDRLSVTAPDGVRLVVMAGYVQQAAMSLSETALISSAVAECIFMTTTSSSWIPMLVSNTSDERSHAVSMPR